ncbi:MAG: AAA family ATPase [Ectopseudomonas guguanensis]|uniref:AAA family ATPase n=1 Tax=Ectopseudomonas guguanensis TaxID=1198456 RepID=UPI00391926D9
MLRKFSGPIGSFEFIKKDAPKTFEDNNFTIIVGKNGTGKSRLLRSIATELISEKVPTKFFLRDEIASLQAPKSGSLQLDRIPQKIICVSTSPFDKFPLPRRDYFGGMYSYLGLRGLPSTNLGLAYMSKIVFSLISGAAKSIEQARSISGVLNYLGYSGEITIILHLPARRLLDEFISSKNPAGVIEEHLKRPAIYAPDTSGHLRHLLELETPRLEKIVEATKRLLDTSQKSKLEINISAKGISLNSGLAIDFEDALLVATSGLLRLREVLLYKRDIIKPIRFSETSSGEQSVVMSLLGIGSQIQDHALICIDEPEICLHPEWQEKYIELLFHTFKNHKNCHFIIATHSPQIVAQIPDGNCYVMSMSSGIARHAREFTHRSIDFQLAEVFNAPGYKNEYLSRIALNAFAKVSKNKHFDKESKKTLIILQKSLRELKDSDPLKELICALEGMASKYD